MEEVKCASTDPCEQCEEMLQPYLDRELTEAERAEAEAHLDGCEYCRKRYRFEETCGGSCGRRSYEPMAAGAEGAARALRTPL